MLLAATETPEGTGRMANALMTAKEFHDAGDEVKLIFDGAGTTWIPVLADTEPKYHRLLDGLRDVSAACLYCSKAYGVEDAVEEAGIAFADDFRDHPSLRTLVTDGYQVVTF